MPIFIGDHKKLPDTPGASPRLRHPICDSAVLPVKKNHEKFQKRYYRDIAGAIEPPTGAGLAQGGQPKHMRRFSPEQKLSQVHKKFALEKTSFHVK
jgi:hypothetical protein